MLKTLLLNSCPQFLKIVTDTVSYAGYYLNPQVNMKPVIHIYFNNGIILLIFYKSVDFLCDVSELLAGIISGIILIYLYVACDQTVVPSIHSLYALILCFRQNQDQLFPLKAFY